VLASGLSGLSLSFMEASLHKNSRQGVGAIITILIGLGTLPTFCSRSTSRPTWQSVPLISEGRGIVSLSTNHISTQNLMGRATQGQILGMGKDLVFK
jgi:hypothetical protein